MSYRPYYAQPNRNPFTGFLAHLPPVTGWLI